MMSKIFMPGLLFLVFLYLPGCMQFDRVIKIKPDGSGFIEETSLIRSDIVHQMRAITENFAKQPDGQKSVEIKSKTPNFFNEAKLEKGAKEFGEGVVYVSSSKVTSGDYEGVKAVYSFVDINKISIKQDVKNKLSSTSGESSASPPDKQKDITFAFSKGKPAELFIRIPVEHNTREKAPAKNKEPLSAFLPGEGGKALLAILLKGMRISLYVDVEGTILQANASYKDGTRVTLLEVDLDKMMENSEKLQSLSQSPPETLEEMRAFITDFPGMKIELNNEVRIKFD